MKSIYDIRRTNCKILIEHVGSMVAFAQQIERSQTQVSRLLGVNPSRNIGSNLARHIERGFCLPDFWVDTDHGNHVNPVNGYLGGVNQEKHNELHQILSDILQAVQEHRIDEVTYTQLLDMAKRAKIPPA